jgi:uncharacterized protein
MTTRSNVRFAADRGIELGSWSFLPASDGPPNRAITRAHSYAGVREHGMAEFAQALVGQ